MIVTTPDAKTAVLEGNPLLRGIVGQYGQDGANHVVSEADLVIYAGSTTSDHTTGGWKLPKQGTAVIQIDIDPLEIGRNYPGTIGLLSDVRAALEAIRAAAPPAKRDGWLAQSKAHFDTWRAEATSTALLIRCRCGRNASARNSRKCCRRTRSCSPTRVTRRY